MEIKKYILGILLFLIIVVLVVDFWASTYTSEKIVTVKEKWIEYGDEIYGAGDEWKVAMSYGRSISAPEPKFLFMDINGELYEIAFHATLAHLEVDPIGVFQRISSGKKYRATIQGWGGMQEVVSVSEN